MTKSYADLIKEAIAALKDRTGSSSQAIKAWIEKNHPAVPFANHHFRAALKRGVAAGHLVQVKASFKLSPAAKKAPKAKKAAAPKKAAAKKAPAAKKAAPKKAAAKK